VATSLKIDDELKDRIRHLADQQDRTPHWIMREAIREYVEREEKRQSFYEEAMQSWTEYQETGLHLTGEDVFEWLSRWGKDRNAEPPACHV
jgi:predicted transcriptional regulator